jgi:hypothetical protein
LALDLRRSQLLFLKASLAMGVRTMSKQHPPHQPLAEQHCQGSGASSDIQGDKLSLIKERLHMHPNAEVRDIVASLEIDGIHVTSDEVQEVLDQAENLST